MMRRGDTLTAGTVYQVPPYAEDDLDVEDISVLVTFEVTVAGSPDHYDASIGGPGGWSPGDSPEAVICEVRIEVFNDAVRRWIAIPAPPEIDAWARDPARDAALWDRALVNGVDR